MFNPSKINLPAEVEQKLSEWVGAKSILEHSWEADGTYFVVVRSGSCLHFIRLFKLGNEYALSSDKQIHYSKIEPFKELK